MKYNAKYFKDNMPEWKRKKDPVLSRLFYRPVSFAVSAVCANLGISANGVSYFSAILGVIASCLFLINNYIVHIIAAVLINVWLILDCTDGNLARSVKKQAFGEFADGISSYLLVGLMCSMMGVAVYFSGGVLFPIGCPWIIAIGAWASSADSLMRLIYQKYKNSENELIEDGLIKKEKDVMKDHSEVGNYKVRIKQELGIGGLLPVFILVASIFNTLDIVLLYCLFYYGMAFIVMTLSNVRKAIKKSQLIDNE